MNPRYPRLPDSSLAEVRGNASNRFTKLSVSASVRTQVGFGMPEKMSSSTSTRAGIDALPPVIALAGLPVVVGLRAAVHASAKLKHATKNDTRMRWPAGIVSRLSHERRPVVLVEVAAEVAVAAAANVVRRIAFTLILVDGMPAVVGVSGRRTAGLVPPPPEWSAGHQAIKMIIKVWPDHQHDCQPVWLATIFPTVGAQ